MRIATAIPSLSLTGLTWGTRAESQAIRSKRERLAQPAELALGARRAGQGKGKNFKGLHLDVQRFESLTDRGEIKQAEGILLEKFLESPRRRNASKPLPR